MKAFITFLSIISFSAFGYEINSESTKLPSIVQETIRKEFDKHCGSVISDIKFLNLEKYHLNKVSVDQGYLDHIHTMTFQIIYKDHSASPFTDRLYVTLAQEIQVRSGPLTTYVLDFRTEYGGDGDAICNL